MNAFAFAAVDDVPNDTADAAVRQAEAGYFARCTGTPLQHLLSPIDGDYPAGLPVRGTVMFRAVEQARRSDDATLPMGAWAADLKRANWPKVSTLIVSILMDTSKDLQLASWLLEAEIHQRSFAAVAPGIALMHGLCARWWDELHPQGERGDFESRTNIVRWINEKLLRTLSLVPLITHDRHAVSWSDWELAHHYERMLAVKGDLPDEAATAPTLNDLHAVLAEVSLEVLRERHAEIAAARAAIAAFEHELRARLAGETPSLSKLSDFLARVQAPIRGEILRRGEALSKPVLSVTVTAPSADREAINADASYADMPVYEHADSGVDLDEAVDAPMRCDRDTAYETLGNVADFLAQIEPHSPVPYLLRRAIEWGGMNTAQLYHELFQRSGGQIDIFELLGLTAPGEPSGEG